VTAPLLQPFALPRLTSREFAHLSSVIERESGIRLTEAKREHLICRLTPRLRDLGLESFADYCHRIDIDERERVAMIDRISTNETHFFREPRHFELLEHEILPRWRARAEAGERPRRLRAWSCACATGEEPYSIAMSLLAACPPRSGWDVRVLGTDISTRALEQAAAAVWPVERAAHIPPAYLKEFMLRGVRTQVGKVGASPELRAAVELRRFNLMSEYHRFRSSFDLVFCRNVLIYFGEETRRHVIGQAATCLRPGGLLFLGHAETAIGAPCNLRVILPTVYALAS
jgi:chemotaxis protein methyltransferase CheR